MHKSKLILIAPALSIAVLAALTACAPVTNQAATPTTSVTSSARSSSPTSALTSELQYLIEEEKLAFDVYTAMNELWGSRSFGNILQSEASHQSQVLAVLNTYGITDPRSSEAGVFANADLQKLYDDLIAQGKQSEVEAYKVGVIIEETDIADLQKMLSQNPPADVATMMDALLAGSENHLSAFNKKL